MRILQHLSMVPGAIFQTLLYGYGEPESQTRITADTRWWLAEQRERNDAELAEARAEVQRWQRAYGDLANQVEQRIAELFPDQFPRFPGDSGTDDRCVGDQVPESLVEMVCAEVQRLRANVVRLTDEHDALDDERADEIALMRAEVDRLLEAGKPVRNPQDGPAIGDTVTLRLESGDHLIGPLYRDAVGRRVVHGWFVDRDGRSLVPAPGGGA
jgi:hypothetical protein